MKVKIKDGGIYRTVEIDSTEYGIYLKRGYTKVIDEEPIEKELKPQGVDKMETIDEVAPIIETGKGVIQEPEEVKVEEEIVVPKPKKKKKA